MRGFVECCKGGREVLVEMLAVRERAVFRGESVRQRKKDGSQ